MMKQWGRVLATAVMASWLVACGSSSGPTQQQCPAGTTGTFPNCQAQQTCTQSVVESGSDSAAARTLVYFDFSVPDSGRLDITVDWTVASSLIGVYLVPANTCTLDEFNLKSCNFFVRSDPNSTKPRKISTPNFNAGNYRWIIGNYNKDAAESFSYQFVLSKGSCPALAGAPPRAASREGSGSVPSIGSAVRH
jgi:hypothetical protein